MLILSGALAALPAVGLVLLWWAERRSGPKLVAAAVATDPDGDILTTAILAGSDLDGVVLCNELEQMLQWHAAGVDVFIGAPKDVAS